MKLVRLIDNIDGLIVDLRYAGPNNFTGRQLYSHMEPRLDEKAILALAQASSILRTRGFRLVIWDAYRSEAVQNELRAVLNDAHYVSPDSNHCKGLAVDVTIADMFGNYVDMGTDFDEFSEKAHVETASISMQQRNNRDILSTAMQSAGFTPWAYEWWHFDFLQHQQQANLL